MSVLAVGLLIAFPKRAAETSITARIRTRDGVELVANVVRPERGGRFPVLLERTSTGRAAALRRDRRWLTYGYAVVVQDCRGRGGSKGDWRPLMHEANDGFDTVEWIARQTWCDGRVGMMGTGYAATAQWLAASERPSALRCIAPRESIANHEGGVIPPKLPCLLISGWGDRNRETTMRLWEGLRRAESKDDWLVYGPQTFAPSDEGVLNDLLLSFYDLYLRDRPRRTPSTARVNVYVTGAKRWIALDGWPATTSTFETRYLAPQMLLTGSGKDGKTTTPAFFTAEPTVVPTTVAGPFEVRLFFDSKVEKVDLSATLFDLAPDGSRRKIGEAARLRCSGLRAGRTATALLRPWDAAHELAPGHRLALQVLSTPEKGEMLTVLTGTVNPSRLTYRKLG